MRNEEDHVARMVARSEGVEGLFHDNLEVVDMDDKRERQYDHTETKVEGRVPLGLDGSRRVGKNEG